MTASSRDLAVHRDLHSSLHAMTDDVARAVPGLGAADCWGRPRPARHGDDGGHTTIGAEANEQYAGAPPPPRPGSSLRERSPRSSGLPTGAY